MTSYKSLLRVFAQASLSVVLVASCAKKDPYLSNNGATFYVDTVTGSFTSDGLNSGFVSRKFINFTACLKDNALQAAIMSLHFQIKAGDVQITKETDERGCLVWQEAFSYDGTDDEKQVLLTRSITGIEGHSGTEVVQLAYDPWDAGDKLAFMKREEGRSVEAATIDYTAGGNVNRKDPETGQDYSVSVDIRGTLESKNLKRSDVVTLKLADEGRDFSQYEIDQNLELTIARKYQLSFNVGVIRTTFSKGLESDPVNTGHFRIYLALLSEGYNTAKGMDASIEPFIVSATQIDTEANLGRIVQEATLRFNNVGALSSRMTGVFTVVSTDEPNHFKETSFEGVLSPVNGGALELDFIPSKNLNAHTLMQMQANYRSQLKSVSPIDLFAQQSGFNELTTLAPAKEDDSKGGASKSGKWKSFLSTDYNPATYDLLGTFKKTLKVGQPVPKEEQDHFGRALCYRYFQNFYKVTMADVYAKCTSQPEKMITSSVRDLVVQVNNPIPTPVGAPIPESMTVSAGIDFSEAKTVAEGHTTSVTGGLSFDANAGIGISWPPTGDAGGGGGGGGDGLGGPNPNPKKKLFNFGPSAGASISGKFSVGRQWYRTTGVVASSDDVTKVGVSRGITVISEGFAFNIDVTTRSCFLIMPTEELKAALGPGAPAGAFYCDPQQDHIPNREEVYYFLNEAPDASGAALADNFSSADVPWRMFIRGNATFSIFETLFTQKGYKLQFEQMPDAALLNQLNASFQTQEFPGMLVPETKK